MLLGHCGRLHAGHDCDCTVARARTPVPLLTSDIIDLLHPYDSSRMLHSLDTSLRTVPRFCLETFDRS